jgi:hypothetical protein
MSKEENKYYTPEIEEFHVGFEYEHRNLPDGEDAEWFPHVFNKHCDAETHKNMERRVKHLDREDIEGCGFEELNEKDEYRLKSNDAIWLEIKHGLVFIENLHERDGNLFKGTIKNKSELKRILKQIGV